jgi:hypothetical protein
MKIQSNVKAGLNPQPELPGFVFTGRGVPLTASARDFSSAASGAAATTTTAS